MKSKNVDEMSLADIHAAIRMYAGVSEEATVQIHLKDQLYCSVTDTPLEGEVDHIDPRYTYKRTVVAGATVTSQEEK